MNPREAIASTFRYEPTPIVPYWLPMEPDVARRVEEHYGPSTWSEKLIPFVMGGFPVGGAGTLDLPGGLKKSPYGTVYQPGPAPHIVKPALPRASLAGYRWPSADSLADYDRLSIEYSAFPGFRLCGMAYGLFERSWDLRGFGNLAVDMVDAPEFVAELMDEYTNLHLQVYDLLVQRVPFEAFFGWGDDCDQRGPMMGIRRWRKFIKPRMARILDHAHALGKPFVAHMCGNVMPLIDDLLEIGLDALESLQAEAMDVYALKRKVEGRMVLIGGMGVQSTLPFGTPADVREEASHLMRELGRGGGYVIAPCKAMLADTPTENAVAFVEAVTNQ